MFGLVRITVTDIKRENEAMEEERGMEMEFICSLRRWRWRETKDVGLFRNTGDWSALAEHWGRVRARLRRVGVSHFKCGTVLWLLETANQQKDLGFPVSSQVERENEKGRKGTSLNRAVSPNVPDDEPINLI